MPFNTMVRPRSAFMSSGRMGAHSGPIEPGRCRHAFWRRTHVSTRVHIFEDRHSIDMITDAVSTSCSTVVVLVSLAITTIATSCVSTISEMLARNELATLPMCAIAAINGGDQGLHVTKAISTRQPGSVPCSFLLVPTRLVA